MRSIVDTARAGRRRACLHLEALEMRCVPAITFNPIAGLISIQGTIFADHVEVSRGGGFVNATLTYDPGTGTGPVTESASYATSQVKKLIFMGSDGDDVFWNDGSVKAIVYGEAGNDYLEGGSLKDIFYGGLGNDTLVGSLRNDRLYGEAGDDLLFGMQGRDELNGGDGNDSIYGGTGSDKLTDTLGINVVDTATDGTLATATSAQGSTKIKYYIDASTLSDFEQGIIDLTNIQRKDAGLPPLRVNLQLIHLADHHAGNMVLFDEMAHVLPQADLPDLQTRLKAYDYTYSWAGENIAWGFETAQDVVDAWMHSPDHRANILNGNFTQIGVCVDFGSFGDAFIAQEFGRPS